MHQSNRNSNQSDSQTPRNVLGFPIWLSNDSRWAHAEYWKDRMLEHPEYDWVQERWIHDLRRGWVPPDLAGEIIARANLPESWASEDIDNTYFHAARAVSNHYGIDPVEAWSNAWKSVTTAVVKPILGESFSICGQLPHLAEIGIVSVAERAAQLDEDERSEKAICGCGNKCRHHIWDYVPIRWLPLCAKPECNMTLGSIAAPDECGCHGTCDHHIWYGKSPFTPGCLHPDCIPDPFASLKTLREQMRRCWWWRKLECEGDHEEVVAKKSPCGTPHHKACWNDFRLDLFIGVTDEVNPGYWPVLSHLENGGVIVAITREGVIDLDSDDPHGDLAKVADRANEAASRFAKRVGANFRASCIRPSFDGSGMFWYITYVVCPPGSSPGRTRSAEIVGEANSAESLLRLVEQFAGNDWTPFMPSIESTDWLIEATRGMHKYGAYGTFGDAIELVKRRLICDFCGGKAEFGSWVDWDTEYLEERRVKGDRKKRYYVVCVKCHETPAATAVQAESDSEINISYPAREILQPLAQALAEPAIEQPVGSAS